MSTQPLDEITVDLPDPEPWVEEKHLLNMVLHCLHKMERSEEMRQSSEKYTDTVKQGLTQWHKYLGMVKKLTTQLRNNHRTVFRVSPNYIGCVEIPSEDYNGYSVKQLRREVTERLNKIQ